MIEPVDPQDQRGGRALVADDREVLPLPVIQRLLGHRSLASTSRYLYVRREILAQLQGPLEGIDLTALRQTSV